MVTRPEIMTPGFPVWKRRDKMTVSTTHFTCHNSGNFQIFTHLALQLDYCLEATEADFIAWLHAKFYNGFT